MIADLKPYPTMKDSGVKWLGRVPKHWEVARAKNVASILNGATPSTSNAAYWDGDILWLTPDDLGALKGFRVTSSSRKITHAGYASCGTSLAPRGSIVVSTRAPIGHLAILDQAGCVNQGCRLFVLREGINAEYIYYLLRTARNELQSLGVGTTFNELSRVRLGGFPLTVPPIAEQTAIVRFLDHADRRIRRYIRAKENLIALLKEQKQAIIHQAVTGQIDVRAGQPYPTCKPSGVEWLGDVPAHWEIKKLRRCGMLLKGNGGNKEDEVPKGIPCIRYGDLYTTHTFFITESRSYISKKNVDKYTALQYSDILFAASGETIAEIGKSAVNLISSESCCGGDIILFRPKMRFDARYLGYLTDCWAATSQKSVMGCGITVMHIYGTQLKNLVLPIAPTTEQNAIVRFLNDRSIAINNGILRAKRETNLLHEYRTRLIADVVTGKIDVREAAATLPEVDPLAGEDTLNDTLDTGSEADIDELDITIEEAEA